MAPNTGLLLLLSILLFLSLAHLALADWSGYADQQDMYSYKKPKKVNYKKYISGYYNGKPSYDYDQDYNGDNYQEKKPIYKKPTKKDKPKPFYPKPDTKPVYPKPSTKPIYKKPPPLSQDSPYQKPIPETKKPYSYYRPKPVAPYRPPQTPPPTTPTYTSPAPSSSQSEWLDPHNAARAVVGIPPLVWSDEVAQYAQSWADQRKAAGCGMEHSSTNYGENIFWGSGAGYGPAECVGAWVSEKQYYNYADNSCSGGQQCGHYTQIIWANTLHLGCARVQCDSGDVFMTCNYDPPGNYIGTKPY